MLHVGSDLSRKRLDWLALDAEGELAELGAVAPDPDALATLGRRLGDSPVLAVIDERRPASFTSSSSWPAGTSVADASTMAASA